MITPMSELLQDRVVIVTGAAGGIGAGDFLRAGNPFSVAAEKPLEVDQEVGLHDFCSVLRALLRKTM